MLSFVAVSVVSLSLSQVPSPPPTPLWAPTSLTGSQWATWLSGHEAQFLKEFVGKLPRNLQPVFPQQVRCWWVAWLQGLLMEIAFRGGRVAFNLDHALGQAHQYQVDNCDDHDDWFGKGGALDAAVQYTQASIHGHPKEDSCERLAGARAEVAAALETARSTRAEAQKMLSSTGRALVGAAGSVPAVGPRGVATQLGPEAVPLAATGAAAVALPAAASVLLALKWPTLLVLATAPTVAVACPAKR